MADGAGPDGQTTVEHDEAGSRFVVQVGGAEAGFAEYVREGGALRFTHTVVDPAHEGKGLGSLLVGEALAGARAQGAQVLPQCSFVQAWLLRNPDQQDLVAPDQRAAYGLPAS